MFAVNQSIAQMNRQLEGDEALALSRFDALAIDYPDDLHVRYCSALLEFRRGELERASEHLQVVLEQDPDDPYAAYFLAQSYQQRGENAAAQDWYRRVVAADPYLRSAYYALAQGYRQLGKPEEARRILPSTSSWLTIHARNWSSSNTPGWDPGARPAR